MRQLFLIVCLLVFSVVSVFSQEVTGVSEGKSVYKYKETQELISLVKDAASVIEKQGEVAFADFKKENSKWRHGDIYIFILDTDGNMVMHPDPALEGKNEIGLKDVNNKPIIRGFIEAVSGAKNEGWFHYQWPEPGSIFPMWKSAFVQLVRAPSGKKYIVGSGLYNMKMEREFIVSLVDSAAALIEKEGEAAFPKFRDKAGQFLFMDVYIFVDQPDGVELVNGAFPTLEGRNFLDYEDSQGKHVGREYINVALTKGAGWVDYLWPKPQEAIPSKKHTYVKKVAYGDKIFIVGSGTYLEDN
jgi:signal transduction histidine kinase